MHRAEPAARTTRGRRTPGPPEGPDPYLPPGRIEVRLLPVPERRRWRWQPGWLEFAFAALVIGAIVALALH